MTTAVSASTSAPPPQVQRAQAERAPPPPKPEAREERPPPPANESRGTRVDTKA